MSKIQALRLDSTLKPAERDRVEMILLSDSGWSPVAIASHLSYCVATVRRVLRQFQAEGADAVRHRPRGPERNTERRLRIQDALCQLLSQERTWSSPQLSAALSERGITLSARSARRYLRDMNARYVRASRTLKHKQDSQKVQRARDRIATLKKSLSRES